jgi:hypothetical protein
LTLLSYVIFSALDREALDDSVFESQFRSVFTSAFAAAAGVAEYRVSVLGYADGSVRVSTAVYFEPSQAITREAFSRVLSTNPTSVFAATDLHSSYGLITATVVSDSPPPPLPLSLPPPLRPLPSPPPPPPSLGLELDLQSPPLQLPPPGPYAALLAGKPNPTPQTSPPGGISSSSSGEMVVVGAGIGGGVLVAAATTVWWCVLKRRKRRKQEVEKQANASHAVGASAFEEKREYKDSAEDWHMGGKKHNAAKSDGPKMMMVHPEPAEMMVLDVELDSHPVQPAGQHGGVEQDGAWRDARLKLGFAHQLEWSELELGKTIGTWCSWQRQASQPWIADPSPTRASCQNSH